LGAIVYGRAAPYSVSETLRHCW